MKQVCLSVQEAYVLYRFEAPFYVQHERVFIFRIHCDCDAQTDTLLAIKDCNFILCLILAEATAAGWKSSHSHILYAFGASSVTKSSGCKVHVRNTTPCVEYLVSLHQCIASVVELYLHIAQAHTGCWRSVCVFYSHGV